MTSLTRSNRRFPVLLGCLFLAFSAGALAAPDRVWAWKNAAGNPAYADQGGLNATLAPSSAQSWLPSALADRDEVRDGNDYNVYVTNRTGGPLEASLNVRNGAYVSTPLNAMHQLIGPGQRSLMARIEPGEGHGPEYSITVVPGDPHAIPDDVVYSLPLDENSPWQFGQAFHGDFSHNDEQNRYAVDLIVPEGTPVLAARDGVVMLAQSGYGEGGLNRQQDVTRANEVIILHSDGSMAVYAHLLQGSVGVQVGDHVGIGAQIGLSGNSGYSSGPHLHFCVQVNTGMLLSSIPFRMVTSRGFLPLPKK
jgi:murein DD-endopeptidase MepM/ murein hydrolase activator NlpD